MNPRTEVDEASIAIAKVIRSQRERVQVLEAAEGEKGHAAKEDPEGLKIAKEDLKDMLEIEEAVAKVFEKLEKRRKKHEEAQAKEAREAEERAEKLAQERAEHPERFYGVPQGYPAPRGPATHGTAAEYREGHHEKHDHKVEVDRTHDSGEHKTTTHHGPVHKK